jgi:hypothetical protein
LCGEIQAGQQVRHEICRDKDERVASDHDYAYEYEYRKNIIQYSVCHLPEEVLLSSKERCEEIGAGYERGERSSNQDFGRERRVPHDEVVGSKGEGARENEHTPANIGPETAYESAIVSLRCGLEDGARDAIEREHCEHPNY